MYMCKDLKKVDRPSRKKPGMQDFFILILCYAYFNKMSNNKNEFSLAATVLADYFNCTPKTVGRWIAKLKDIGAMKQVEREDAGKTVHYKIFDEELGIEIERPYTIPKFKKIRVGKKNECKFVNVYEVNQEVLNQYLVDRVDIDVLGNVEEYKPIFDKCVSFLSSRHSIDELKQIAKTKSRTLTKSEKLRLKKEKNIERKAKENKFYIDMKAGQDIKVPDFPNKYLEEGTLRLTHEICSTVNPEHTEKINESNYWRSSHIRNDMLNNILNTRDCIEHDVNGSIYRLTYNLYHSELLDRDADIYELIWNAAFSDIKWPDKSYRKDFKYILMPIYMKEHTTAYKVSQYNYIDRYYYGRPNYKTRFNKKEREQFETFKKFVELTGVSIFNFLNRVRKAMHNVLNTKKFLGADIFIHESNLHILMKERLLNKDIVCVNIYDGFYFKTADNISKDDFYNVYTESVQELKDNLEKGIGSPIGEPLYKENTENPIKRFFNSIFNTSEPLIAQPAF